jgi:4-hydroxybenzoate polyprenyltransferase
LVVAYDGWAKHSRVLGPVNMGLCRGGNLLLGMAASAPVLAATWPLAAVPTVYIAAVTLLSRGEVSGGGRSAARLALTLLVLVLGALTVLSATADPPSIGGFLLTGFLAARILPAFYRASQSPEAGVIRQAVRTGILSLVLLDGVLATVYAGMIYGLALLATAFVAVRLARMFAVT